jgi:hypothetical protein
VIVKTGDDCRQELLAMQLIRASHEIFAEAQLPLWLRPYEVRRQHYFGALLIWHVDLHVVGLCVRWLSCQKS